MLNFRRKLEILEEKFPWIGSYLIFPIMREFITSRFPGVDISQLEDEEFYRNQCNDYIEKELKAIEELRTTEDDIYR